MLLVGWVGLAHNGRVDEQWLPDDVWDEAAKKPGPSPEDDVHLGPFDGGTLAWSRSGAVVHFEIVEIDGRR